jgi:uncharacterized SAM-binding protein YcdF (DUF218 family)
MTSSPDPASDRATRRQPWPHRALYAGAGAVLIAILWLSGLLWFASVIPTAVAEPARTTDAIVVLTGGSGRLKAGFDLLAQGKAKKLFVSGVYHGVDVDELLRLARVAPKPLECCVALGYAADSTYGNALETARWMAAQGYKTLRLVTSAYHMPRSLLEFRRAMPGIEIVPNPVFAERVKSNWWLWPGTGNLVIGEYDKYLFALVRDALSSPIPAGS